MISTRRLRFAVGESSGVLDAELTARRDAAIALLEKETGRTIIDRSGYVTEPTDFARYVHAGHVDVISFTIADVKAGSTITLTYSEPEDAPAASGTQTQSFTLPSTRVYFVRDSVTIYPPPDTTWADIMRFDHPVPTLTATLGMAAAEVPAPFGEAVALLVREMLEGSSFDAVPGMSPVSRLLAPYRKNPYGAFTRSVR